MSDEPPDGWTRTKLNDVLEPGGLFDGPFGSSLKTGDYTPAGVRVIRLENIANLRFVEDKYSYISQVKYATLKKHTVGEGDIIVGSFVDGAVRVCVLPRLNTTAIAKADCFCVRTRCELDRRFLAFQLASRATRDALVEEIHGATRPRITTRQLRDFEILVAPLAEQRRIVAKVESLLEQVNRAKARLNRTKGLLSRLRQSVLAAACSGTLTEAWRAQAVPLPMQVLEPKRQGARRAGRLWGGGEVPDLTDEERTSIPEVWQWKKVAELGNDPDETVQIGPMSMRSSQFTENGVPVLNVGCVQSGWIDETKCDHLPLAIATGFERYRIKANDVLFTRSGTVGRSAVATSAHEGNVITFHLLRVRTDPAVARAHYLRIAFAGAPSIARQTGEGQIGSTRGGFNTRLLASLDVPVPPLQEQDEIVRRVNGIFSVISAIERSVLAAADGATTMVPSILAKAFTGELVPTEAELARAEGRSYETAEELLARVRKTEAPQTGTRKRGRVSARSGRRAAAERSL